MPDRTEYYIESHGPKEDAVKLGLQWLVQLGNQDTNKQKALIATRVKRTLEGVVESVVGEKAVKALKNKNPVTVGDIEMRHMTERIDVHSWSGGPILAVYPSRDLLDKIDEMRGVTDVLVIPWHRDDVQFWIDQWGATELGSRNAKQNEREAPSIDDNIVEEALHDLDSLVNVSTGLTHSSDRSQAIEMFNILHRNGYKFDPEAIRIWLVAEKDWSPTNADDVQEIAEGVKNGKRFQYESGRWVNDILDQWKDRAGN
ncbi:hypothetical protein [Halococcus sp. IIIV-5B]|uniref:hypothetical protein n=1 Tax=Halococcus sp. IIIV-5B TaxID=2321230 RepID=UPI0011C3F950|nr:hypothetical protein [Halococcus sp. IIIV-5B]